jgi:hypothetical protein
MIEVELDIGWDSLAEIVLGGRFDEPQNACYAGAFCRR